MTPVQAAPQEGQGGGQPNDHRRVYLDRTVHPTAADSCNPVFLWQGADIRSTYVDGDGLVHIEVPAGPQPGVANRAAWNFTYSYDVALGPGNPDLEEYDAQLWIDLDPSTGTDYLKLTLGTGGAVQPVACGEPDLNGYVWYAGDTPVIPDDEGTRKVTQNSQNYAFYTTLVDSDPKTPGVQAYDFGPAQFDVVMLLRDRRNQGGWTILHVAFDVVTAPTQTP